MFIHIKKVESVFQTYLFKRQHYQKKLIILFIISVCLLMYYQMKSFSAYLENVLSFSSYKPPNISSNSMLGNMLDHSTILLSHPTSCFSMLGEIC